MSRFTDEVPIHDDYIFTDHADYIPYFMVAHVNYENVGEQEPKYFGFGTHHCQTSGYSLLYMGNSIRHVFGSQHGRRYWGNNLTVAPKMFRATRDRLKYYYNSLFLMYDRMQSEDFNILMIGVVKEEDVNAVRAHINGMTTNFSDYSHLVEVWIADDFDVVKSRHPIARSLYRRKIRKYLIEQGIRIIPKPQKVINKLFLDRTIRFETLSEVNAKLKDVCKETVSLKLLQLESQIT
jgi:hypothetical protein